MEEVLLVPVGADNAEAPPHSPSLLAVLSLEAALRAAGQRADVFFYFNEYWPTARVRLRAQLAARKYGIIGLSFMSYNRLEAYELLREIETILPDCRVIVGGVHASFLYEQILRHFPNVRAVAIGEGEEALVQFCRAPDDLSAVPGIAWLDAAGQLRLNARAQADGRDLDALPMIDYALIRDCPGVVPVLTTKGCVGRCVFCAWRMLEPRVRTKSPKRIVAEWEQVRDIFGPNHRITIMDALYNVSLEHVKGMCQALIDAGLASNSWDAELRARPVDREMLALMKRAGCKAIAIGVETGNEAIRRNIGKAISNDDLRRMFALAHEVKLPTHPFLMTGLPGETNATVAETIEFAREIKPYYNPTTIPAQVFPGTPLYDRMKECGLIHDQYWLHRHPSNWGYHEICGNMPIYTAEQNLLQLISWCTTVNQSSARIKRSVSRERVITSDEEYDALYPWREDDLAARLRQLLARTPRGTWKGRLRRHLRPIHSAFHVAPRRLYPGQMLAFSVEILVHWPADVYLLVYRPDEDRVRAVVWEGDSSGVYEEIGPFATHAPAGQRTYWTQVLRPNVFREQGRYHLHLIACKAGESPLDRNNWFDWRRETIEVRG